MNGKSFLRVFDSTLHAAEAAAAIAAPIIATVDPEIGGLMQVATLTAIQVESSITTPGSGPQKQQAVQQSTQAAFDLVNLILKTQGKPPLPPNTVTAAVAGAVTTVNILNSIANTADAAKPATPPQA